MDCELSIIVPVYNASDHISRTVECLITQRIEHYEIILVDDGSTDDTPLICDRLSKTHDNIQCCHIENSGPGHARNIGISKAKGRYIAFCDSDDLPSPNMYGTLLKDLKDNEVEHSLCDIYTERDNKSFGFPWLGNSKFEGREVIDKLLASMLGNLSDNDSTQPIWGSSVRGIYIRDIIKENNIRFPENIKFAEDLVFNVRYISKIHSCYIRNEALYRYTYNRDSLMNSHVRYNKDAFRQRINLVNLIVDELDKIPDNEELISRFRTSQRCYYLEMAGNAARSLQTEGYGYALREMNDILNDSYVIDAFKDFDAKSIKKYLSYLLIKRRFAHLLLNYFRFRLRK